MLNLQAKLAADFAAKWKDKGYEKGESQKFWLELLQSVLGVQDPYSFIAFEDQVHLDHTSFIDGHIEATHVLIEQKSIDKDLRKPIKQSDGSLLTPFQQAKRYSADLPYSLRPRWVVTCNFRSFLVYDMEQPNGEPWEILLENLETEYYRLNFLVDTGSVHLKREMEISLQAGEMVGRIYEKLLAQYRDPNNKESLRSLNILCTRLVFCLYAEDANIFGQHDMFHDYLAQFKPGQGDMRRALIDLFNVLDTPVSERDPYLADDLNAFPYVSGGLFRDKNIEIPRFTDEIASLLLDKASLEIDWSHISPTIFGAVFESTLNPDIRRSGGMHYTSIENIHKVIDPLFLDDLKAEFKAIKESGSRNRNQLLSFQEKIASLKFFDPACGSGNFLTETYLCLRRLENQVIRELYKGQGFLGGIVNPIKVSLSNFYGIEINDFAVTVACTALWIAEAQMMIETEGIVQNDLEFLPLKSYSHIVEGNALRLNWEELVPKDELNYIMGNPPFVGFTFETDDQKADMDLLFPKIKNLDYVCGWYKKASELIDGTIIKGAFVSTNSITQGETVPRFWPNVKLRIDFAYRSFIWNSEASIKAHVHCVIIGFSSKSSASNKKPMLFSTNGVMTYTTNINYYLLDAPDIIVQSINKPLCDIPPMIYGNKPVDGGNLIIEEEDYEDFVKNEPAAVKWIFPLTGAVEYLHNKKRYCLWLTRISPAEIKSMPLVLKRVAACKAVREASIAPAIRKFAETPHLFAQRTQPEDKPFIIVPLTTGETRRYIPLGFMPPQVKCTNACSIIPNATLYHFGVLTSNVHMAWMRAVCGRLKSDYRYSKDVVYNNFPWPTPTEQQMVKIEQTAQAILDARALYPDSSLADLYDEVTMPIELRRAHQENDRAVMEAYGFDVKTTTESSCVAYLFEMYKALSAKS
jgi:hypothetical protein